MKLILLLGTLLLLSGCALMGVYGPEAQERARERLQQAGEQMRQAGGQMRDGFAQLGNSLDQMTNTAARAAGTYAQGYSQTYQSYQPQAVPNIAGQSGLINTPGQFPSLYHVDAYGNGVIYPPVDLEI